MAHTNEETLSEIKLRDNNNPSVDIAPKLCTICGKEATKYVCPRCYKPYCCAECYKKHNAQCTEGFYRDNVMEAMQNQKPTEEEKKKVMKALKRIHESDDNDFDADDLTDALMSLDLDDPDLFSKLPREYQEEFKKAMQEGRLSDLIAMWKPWWYLPHDTPTITPLEPIKTKPKEEDGDDEESSDEEEQDLAPPPSQVPLILDDVKPLSTLTSAPPSPLVMYNIIEVLYAYAYTARIFNGEYHDVGIDAVNLISDLSSVLSENKIYQNGTEALHKSLENSLKPHVKNSRGFSISVLEDVNELFKAKKFILAALSDLYRLFDAEAKMDEDEQKRQAEHKLRPRPIDINQKLEILFHTLEEVEEEKNAIFFSDLTTVQYSDEPEPVKNAAVPIPRITVLKDDGVTKKLKPFTRPKNYIEFKERSDSEVAKSTEYEIDDEDDEFIEALNDRPTKKKETSNMNFEKFENIIDFFEKEVYYKKKMFFIDDSPSICLDPNDMPCAICASSKTSNENPMLVCQGCRVVAHQKCCGLKKVSKADWKCERCSQEKKKLSCELCPVTDGVFYPKKGELWVHLACAYSFNEIPIQVLPNGYAIKSFEKLTSANRTAVCYLCDIRKGACIKCLDEDCEHYFHVSCALKRGLDVHYNEEITARHKTKSKNHGELAPVLEACCIKHSVNTRMLTKNKKHLFVHKEFKQEEIDELVRLGNSSSRKISVDKETLEVCYRNWISRRVFIGKPLITRLQEVVKEEKDARKRSTKLVVDEEKYKQLKKIRQSLERTRLLIDLSRKRELAKKSLINHYQDIYEFLVKEQTGKGPKKSPTKQQPAPAPAPAKKPVFVKIKKEPGTTDKDDDEMSLEATNKSSLRPSLKSSPKKKINGHAHNKAVTPVTKAVNGRLTPSSKKEAANGRSPANKKSSPATKKNEPNGTSKPTTKSPTRANGNRKSVIVVKSQSSAESESEEQSSEQEESESSSKEESEKEESSVEDEDQSSDDEESEKSSESSDEEESSSEEKSSASVSSKSKESSSKESQDSDSDSDSESESDEKEDEKPVAQPVNKKKPVAVKPSTNNTDKNKKQTTKQSSSTKRPNNRGDRHTKPPPPTRNRPVPVLGTPTRKRAPPGQSSSSKKRKRDSTSFTSNKKQKLRR